MSRKAFLDEGYGQRRGVVLLDGRPERLVIEWDDDAPCQRLGARSAARVRTVDKAQGIAFLALPEGPDAVTPAARLTEGRLVEVEIAAEARAEKGAVATVLAEADGEVRLIAAAPTLEARLEAWAGGPPGRGAAAREAADLAEDAALAIEHHLPGGGRLAIEPTRALVAVDVDIAGRRGNDARRLARTANLSAIAEAARLIRLKGLGGLIVIDLVGKGHDGKAMSEAAARAFEPDQPGLSIGPISRFGAFELVIPHRLTPIDERLLDGAGQLSLRAAAARIARALEHEARIHPGARLDVRCSADVSAVLETHIQALKGVVGARLTLSADPLLSRTAFEIATR